MKILLENYFDESEAEKFIKLYIKRGRKSFSESCQCKVNEDRCKQRSCHTTCVYCFIGSLKGPYSHQYYLNKNFGFLTETAQLNVKWIVNDMQVGALQNEKLKKMLTPVGTAKISKSVFKVGKLKMNGANLTSCSQYYKV